MGSKANAMHDDTAPTETQTTIEQRKVADLLEVLEVSRQLGASTDLLPLLMAIERSALHVLDCERATVFLHDPATDELYSEVATGGKQIRFPSNLGIAGEVFRDGAVVNVPDAYSDARFNQSIDKQTGFRTRNILTCPLVGFDGKRVGVVQVLNKRRGGFSDWDVELVKTLGAQAGVAIQRQLLLEEYAAKRRIERDLNIARDIQQALLPKESPKLEHFDIAGWNQPADATGGDYFDFQPLDDGRIAITIADVTGHGIGPAIVVAEARALTRAVLTVNPALDSALEQINRLLCADLPQDRFITACLVLLDPKTGKLHYKSAGHGPLLHYQRVTDEVKVLPIHGVPLGVFDDFPYDEQTTIQLKHGDFLFLITDGFEEWANPDGDQFGTQRISQIIRTDRDLPASEMIQSLHESVLRHANGTTQLDDLTAVVIKRNLPEVR